MDSEFKHTCSCCDKEITCIQSDTESLCECSYYRVLIYCSENCQNAKFPIGSPKLIRTKKYKNDIDIDK